MAGSKKREPSAEAPPEKVVKQQANYWLPKVQIDWLRLESANRTAAAGRRVSQADIVSELLVKAGAPAGDAAA